MAQWVVVTDDDGVVQVIRDDTPAGDPEHTQTLANLPTLITTAARPPVGWRADTDETRGSWPARGR